MTAADQLGSPLGGRFWPVTKKYWVLFAVLGTVAVCLYSTGTEWTLLNLQATSLSVGVHNKPHALNHLTSSGDSLGETANDTPDKNTTSSVEPSSSPPLPAPSTAHSPSTATTPSTGEHIITREHVAIVAYVPPGMPKFVREAQHMLWSSWNYSVHQVDPSTRGNTDLIFFAHHDVVDGMPASCVRLVDISHAPSKSSSTSSAADRCYVVEHTPPADAYWHRYNFMFSLSFLAEPAYEPLLMSYDRLLRTDTDVVITPAFLTFRPRQFVVGRGGYMIEEYTKTRIKQLATDLHMTHQSLYNVGSTWFGNTSVTLLMVPKMLDVAKFILESPKYNQDEGFPRWHPNVASMYAGELVVNHFIPKENVWVNLDSLDINCNGHEKTADVYHSHCWPGEYQGYFKKWAFERGEYTPVTFPRDKLDIAVINDYFMAMAVYGY